MPELPEVETVRRTLLPHILGRTICSLLVLREGSVAGIAPAALEAKVVGGLFCRAVRRGKYLGLILQGRGYLVLHLRMTGRLVVRPASEPHEKHLCLALGLDDGQELRFVDQRRFGKVYWADSQQGFAAVAKVGVEPLSAEFTPDVLARCLRGSRMRLKAALLDQGRLAGLGNIYADESLFRAGIHPERPAGSLTEIEVERLWRGIREALTAALENGGTTLRDYVDGDGRPGSNQYHLLVYGKAGKPCPKCGSPLMRLRVAGRGTVYCPGCQL